MAIADATKIIRGLSEYWCKSVTITGGGEPLMHPDFGTIVSMFESQHIKLGMATNGTLLGKTTAETLRRFTWIRISNDDSRSFDGEYRDMLQDAMHHAPNVDWAFSHVVSSKPNLEEIRRIVRFANTLKMTHVRIVPDLFMPGRVDLEKIRQHLAECQISDERVIYQPRREYTRGGECYIGYLKPLIGPDCKVYACCGVQYALDPPSYDLPEELCLGSALELDKLYAGKAKALDGSKCVKCYYTQYNKMLAELLSDLEHVEFV
jgi:MoaA/NifB/PqqE/SkfB family radical SAM enzyme